MKIFLLFVGLSILAAPALAAEPLPANVPDLLSRAWNRENDEGRQMLETAFKRAYPDSIAEIDQTIAGLKLKNAATVAVPTLTTPVAAAPVSTTAAASTQSAPKSKVDGQLELGLAYTKAIVKNSSALISGRLDITHGRWSHLFLGTVDFNKTSDQPSVERYLASYEIGRQVMEGPTFVKALVSFERDPLSGYEYRFTQSLGIGTRLDLGEEAVLNFAGGPSSREFKGIDGTSDTNLGARATIGLDWRLSPTVTSSSGGSLTLEQGGLGTREAQTSLTAKVVGPLAARLQLNYRSEKSVDLGTRSTTISRASFVYSF